MTTPLCLNYYRRFLWIGLAFPLWAGTTNADQIQPIYIESERFNLDYQSSVATYDGNVTAHQGSRHLKGNKLVIKSTPQGKVTEIVVTGTPAYYDCLPQVSSTLVAAQALSIVYEPEKNLLTLVDDAQIEQQGNIFKGPLITYNIETEIINSPSSELGRSSMVLQPLNHGIPQ